MREDAGLLKGAEAIWQEGLLYDYTLKIQDKEIRAHKFILASVSDYFRAMLCGTMSESTNDSVELKEVDAELMSDIIKFIYTGDDSIISNNPKEILELAVYFQMPKVIKECKKQLMSEVSIENCIELLTIFEDFSLKDGVKEMTNFIQDHVQVMFRYYPDLNTITPKALDIILSTSTHEWINSDVAGFGVVVRWLEADYEKRKQYTDHFLSRINFHIMTLHDIKEIMEMDEYERLNDTWKAPIEKMYAYHNLPAHQRIWYHSEKSNAKGKKLLFGINPKRDSRFPSLSMFYILQQMDGENTYKKYRCVWTEFTGTVPFVIEVNNFLITCSEFGEDQQWKVFDTTTLTWFEMANMSEPRDNFAMVQHGRHLYVLGGCVVSGSQKFLTDTVEEYSFDTGTWSATKKLPVAVKNHSTCVLNDCIYVSGGQVTTAKSSVMSARLDCLSVLSARLDCLNLSTGTWESKADMLRPTRNHKMCVMIVAGKETIVVIDRDMRIQYYDPASDQWSTCQFYMKKHNYQYFRAYDGTTAVDCKNFEWGRQSRMLVDGNTVYFLNLKGQELDYYRNKDDYKYVVVDTICLKWVVAEEKRDEIHEYTMAPFIHRYNEDDPPPISHAVHPLNAVRTTPINAIYGLVAFLPEVLLFKRSWHWV